MNRVGRYDSDVFFKGYHPSLGIDHLVDKEEMNKLIKTVTAAVQCHGQSKSKVASSKASSKAATTMVSSKVKSIDAYFKKTDDPGNNSK